MLVSKKMLSYIDPIFDKITEKHFSSICNQVGIELEQVIRHPKVDGLVICYIKNIEKHPNADKLNLVTIKLPSGNKKIVCGASNLKIGKYAIYAPVGTTLYDGKKIEAREIRGIESSGMLCGYSEITNLGIDFMNDEDKMGIVLLDEAKIGDRNIANYILNDDIIYDLSLPSNRNDLNGLLFLVNELFIALRRDEVIERKLINNYDAPLSIVKKESSVASDISFIEANLSQNFQVDWKQKQILMSCGYKIHNNLLDLMNLFTINYGNPIHIYDAKHLSIRNLSVKKLEQNEKIICLDGKEYSVPKGSIGIYNRDELINIAGIMGDEKHKYSNDATKIIIEIGNFNPNLIRKTSEKLAINSKSSQIFSKPLSSWITQRMFIHIADFLKDSNIDFKYSYNFEIVSNHAISYDYDELYRFIGTNKPISFNQSFDNGVYKLAPWRTDVNDQYDVFEEAIKIIDINELEPQKILFSANDEIIDNNQGVINKIRNYLLDQNFIETKTYNLTSTEEYDTFNLFDIKNQFIIKNPISKIREIMRVSLFDEMLKVIKYNVARKRHLYNIFEIQNININEDEYFKNLSIVIHLPLVSNLIEKSKISNSIVNIKSLISNMLLKINVKASFQTISKIVNEQQQDIIVVKANKISIGYIMKAKNKHLKKYDLNDNVYLVSLNLDSALENVSNFKLKPLSPYPVVHRDINLFDSKSKNIMDIINKIKSLDNISNCYIKDLFEKDNQKIYTIHLEINSLEKTLSTSEIDEIISNISNNIIKNNSM